MARPSLRPVFIKITVFYFVAVVLLILAVTDSTGIGEFLPVGAGGRLFDTPQGPNLTEAIHSGRLGDRSVLAQVVFLALSFICSAGLSVPVAWTYLATRTPKKRDATFAQAIVLLPIAITGLVLIVQNSLALSFALAGIVAGAGIRFRTNIREVVDTLFFLIAIGIGIAAGVGSLGLAAIMSIVFTYSLLITTALDFGGLSRASDKESKNAEGDDSADSTD